MGPKKRPTVMPGSPSTPAQMKFRSTQEVTRGTAKGTKPLPEPTSISEILTQVVVCACKRILFLDSRYRFVGYTVLLFLVSLIADHLPFPKTYFAYSGNIPNQWFVKYSWAWTLTMVAIFVFVTTSVYCVGDIKKMLRHFSRLLVATMVWLVWTNIFAAIEESTGVCKKLENQKEIILYSVKGRRPCGSSGGKWSSFDLSGHAFLLMWCVLFITEEARSIIGWETIKDFIRHEDHNRLRTSLAGVSGAAKDLFAETPLRYLSQEEFDKVKTLYSRYEVIANIQLVILTAFVLLWDGMLIATAIYFHVMLEKVLGGIIAALMWFLTYRCYYTWNIPLSPGLPGKGLFKYSTDKSIRSSGITETKIAPANVSVAVPNFQFSQTRQRDQELPQFMGMPLYALRKPKNDLSQAMETS